ncbi:AraC family transcriptional regulator [Allorhizobium taibaishanense]|nr:AraC family transcriptional regulator [Allorhizobium taibaishanense]OLP51710.1 hypothetical protein BJF91_15570 [Allorhizobium taibaishanense]
MRRLRAQSLEPTLSERFLRIGDHPYRWFTHLIFVAAGTIRAASGETSRTIPGPCLLLLPASELVRLRLSAGSRGYLFGAALDIIADAIGDYPESEPISRLIGIRTIMSGLTGAQAHVLDQSLAGLVEEINGDGQPSSMAVSARLRLLLHWVWRENTPDEPATSLSSGGSVPLLQRFRQLVEADYRQHLAISIYATRLGVTTDRLHDLCRRNLGRSPLELLHERLCQEARIRLERSDASVRDLSETLGFRDPAHFSHFFKNKTGLSPASYRRMVRQSSAMPGLGANLEYHDWP